MLYKRRSSCSFVSGVVFRGIGTAGTTGATAGGSQSHPIETGMRMSGG